MEDVTIKAKTKGQGLIFGTGNSKSVFDCLKVEDSDGKGTVLPAGTYNKSSFEAGGLTINRVGKYRLNESNAGTNAPAYLVEENTFYNAKLKLT